MTIRLRAETETPRSYEEILSGVENTAKRLDEIAVAIKKGAKPEKFQAEIDKLLGTELTERDEETEAAWEQGYRNGDD